MKVFNFQFSFLGLRKIAELFSADTRGTSLQTNNYQLKTNFGYSLVEVLVAISVLLISIVGPLTIASKGLQNSTFAKQQNIAFFLAQEGLESIIKIREEGGVKAYALTGEAGGPTAWDDMAALDSFDCTADTPCGVDVDDFSVFSCDDRTCDIYLHDSGRARYRHSSSGGTATPYRREIVLDVNDSRAYVESTVTWGETEDKKVVLATYIYNIYEK